MNVLHVVGGDLRAGGNRAAHWLHRGLSSLGVRSRLLGPLPWAQRSELVLSTSARRRGRLIDDVVRLAPEIFTGRYARSQPLPFSTGFPGRRLRGHPAVREADVINVHWVARGPLSVRGIGRLGKPTVWTLHDMWAFTGGCHVALGCERYRERCGACPQLGSMRERDLSRLVWSLKHRWYPDDLSIVAPSSWMAECARSSSLLGGHDIRVIPNGIDTETFFPVPPKAARQVLGLPQDRKLVLAGAESLGDSWKGMDLLVEALRHGSLTNEPVALLLFGAGGRALDGLPFEVHRLGYVADDTTMRAAYSAADVFVAPSRQESFGLTVAEALCCGTPVVSFAGTGPDDIIEHQRTGYLARPFDTADLATGMRWALFSMANDDSRRVCSEEASERFATARIARRYADLYAELAIGAGEAA